MRWLFLCLLAATCANAQEPLSAADIMARVAANQDRSVALRKEYVYDQHVHSVSRETNGKLMREVTSDYQVTPTPDGIHKQLVQESGRYYSKGKYVDFSGKAPTTTASTAT